MVISPWWSAGHDGDLPVAASREATALHGVWAGVGPVRVKRQLLIVITYFVCMSSDRIHFSTRP
jgi:hypothetical protein